MIEFVKDNEGNFSHARLIAVMVGLSATIFMWKLLITGTLNTTYFSYYLMYGVVHQNINKALDVLGAKFGLKQPTE